MSGTGRMGLEGINRTGRIALGLMALGLMALGGLAFVLVAAFVVRPATNVPDGWLTVEGRVVTEQLDRSGDSVVAFPVVEYVDAQHVVHRVTSGTGSSIRSTIGDPMEVAYNPLNPANARVTGGMASMGWLLFAGVSGVFAALGGLLLLGTVRVAPGRTISDVVMGGAVLREADGREAYTRSRVRGWINLYAELVGGLVLLFVGLFVSPGGIPTVLSLLFSMILLLGAWWAFRRRKDPVAEVREDGMVTPDLGFRRWDELAEMRIERYPGTDDSATGYRRLGLVPRDPSLAAARPGSERAMWAMVRPMLHTYTVAGVRVDDPAPFGISEQEIGREAFERLVASIGRHHEVIGHGAPLAMPAIVEAALPSLATAGRAPARPSQLLTGIGELLGVMQVFLVLGVLWRVATVALAGPQAWASLPIIVIIALISVAVAARPVRSMLGRGVTRRARAVLAAAVAVGVAAGIFLPELLMAIASG